MVEFYPQDPRYYLQHELSERLKRRKLYSLRAFARDLEVSPAALSGFLSGQTSFSNSRILDFSIKIKLSKEQTEHWVNLNEYKAAKSVSAKKVASLKIQAQIKQSKKFIDLDSFTLIAQWEAFALLELFGFEKSFTKKQLSSYLGLSLKKLDSLTQTLLRLNLIYWSIDRWRPTEEDSFVGLEVPSKALRRLHAQVLKKAAAALEKQPLEKRDFRSTVFSFRKKDLPKLKQDLNHFWMDQIGKYAMPNKNDSIYCFSMQLFDLINGELIND